MELPQSEAVLEDQIAFGNADEFRISGVYSIVVMMIQEFGACLLNLISSPALGKLLKLLNIALLSLTFHNQTHLTSIK